MKICDLTQATAERSRGVLTYLDAKRDYMEQKPQHRHIVVVPGKFDQVEYRGNTTIYHLGANYFPWGRMGRHIARLDKVIAVLKQEKPDVVELGSPVVLPYAGFYCRKHFSSVVVGFCHNEIPDYLGGPYLHSVNNPASGRLRWLMEKYACSIYNRCDATITASRYLLDRLKKLGVARVRNIQLGVDLHTFHPDKYNAELRTRIGIKEDEKLLVYAGRLDRDKRIDILLDAFQMISPHFRGKLLLVGDGPARKDVFRHIRYNAKILTYPYQADRNRLAEILASADIYVSAGPFETFGLSIIEAQACGLPVVGIASGAVTERLKQRLGILSQKDSPQSLAINIMRMASRDIQALKPEIRQWVEEQYSWKKTFANLFRLYSRLRNQKGHSH
jgi:alpha-1,6-mannosyltransferase